MKIPDKLILVSRASINTKLFKVTKEKLESELKGEELEKSLALLPTEDEQEFMNIFESNIVGLERLQRKMSVCLDAEVIAFEDDFIEYEYSGNKYKITEPKNAFKICNELEKGTLEAFTEVAKQGCFYIQNVEIYDIKKDGAIRIDALKLAIKVCDKFFFQTFL